jgi:hypothetical protein
MPVSATVVPIPPAEMTPEQKAAAEARQEQLRQEQAARAQESLREQQSQGIQKGAVLGAAIGAGLAWLYRRNLAVGAAIGAASMGFLGRSYPLLMFTVWKSIVMGQSSSMRW